MSDGAQLDPEMVYHYDELRNGLKPPAEGENFDPNFPGPDNGQLPLPL